MIHLQNGISPVNPDDFERVIVVWEASVRATHHFVSESDIEIFRPLVREEVQSVPVECVRDDQGAVVGFMIVGDGSVEALFIHPDWRGQGIGRRLFQHAVDDLGATAVDVNEQNEQALGFYLRMGFEVVGRSDLDSNGKPFPLLHM
ncbi:MAG: acetyltransferase, partial [Chloroflexota bacterium]